MFLTLIGTGYHQKKLHLNLMHRNIEKQLHLGEHMKGVPS